MSNRIMKYEKLEKIGEGMLVIIFFVVSGFLTEDRQVEE